MLPPQLLKAVRSASKDERFPRNDGIPPVSILSLSFSTGEKLRFPKCGDIEP
ncbi:conserved hypothetical protein [Ricinus communis]|uniref:Uncharacterized protein n=1 Tax=Ricinus communis TaxID=3988 RepID=B9RNM9_RICCO|nr:conserved hypothetical protein [Ricinus communis]